MRIFWLCFWLVPAIARLNAQDPAFLVNSMRLGVETGLSSREALSCHEDREGFIWVGTRHGLNFFDGHNFTVYDVAEKRIVNDTVDVIAEDGEGWFWLLQLEYGAGRLSFFHPRNAVSASCAQRFGEVPFDPASVQCVWALPDGSILFTVKKGGSWHYRPGAGFQALSWPVGVRVGVVLGSGRVLVCTGDGKRWAVADDGRQTLHWLPDAPEQLFNMVEFGEHALLAFGIDGVYRLNGRPGEPGTSWTPVLSLNPGEKFHASAKVAVHPGNGAIFIGSSYRIFILTAAKDGTGGLEILHQERVERPVTGLEIDRAGTVWITTQNGLYLFRLEPWRFTQLLRSTGEPGSGSTVYNCRGLAIGGDGKLYVAQENGQVISVDLSEGQVRPLTGGGGGGNTTPIGRTLALEPGGRLLIGGPRLYDYVPGRGVRTLSETDTTQQIAIWSICRSGRGWWLGTQKGLFYLEEIPGARPRRLPDEQGGGQLADSRIVQIVPTGEPGAFWLAATSGLYRLEEGKGITARYWPGGQGPYFLPAQNIQYLYRDPDGVYWLATSGEGLIRWTPGSGEPSWQKFAGRQGVNGSNLYAIYEDRHRHLWMSSDFGLLQFDKDRFHCRTYLPADGLSHYEFNRLSHYRAPDGRLFFGGLDGITTFDPEVFYPDSGYHVPLVLAQVQRYDAGSERYVDMTAQVGRHGGSIELPSNGRLLSVTVALQDYFYALQTVYEYRLDEESNWIALQGNEIRLSGLSFGRHSLRVRARGAHGQYTDQQLLLSVRVQYPLYLRWWFIALAVLSAMAAVWLGLRWRTRALLERQAELETAVLERTETIERQAAELRELDEVKSRFFANISHELRTPLTLISGPAEHLMRNRSALSTGELDETLHFVLSNSRKLLELVEELLELSRLDARQVRLKKAPVMFYPFCCRVFGAFESQALIKQVEYGFDFLLDEQICLNIDAGRLEKIFNNLVVNALKFTSAGQSVRAVVSRRGSFIEVDVCDTGCGIREEDLPNVFDRYFQSRVRESGYAGGAGIGLALARELALLMEGDLRVESRWQQGSTFTLRFPEELAEPALAAVEDVATPLPAAAVNDQPINDSSGQASVLVVEDNPDMQRYLGILLAPLYKVVTAVDGQQAWDWLAAEAAPVEHISLIVSDVMMPRLDGFGLLQRIKHHARWRRLPVILLTARSAEVDKLQALRLGVDDYLTKPFSPVELQARIANLLANYRERLLARALVVEGTDDDALASADDRWLQQLEEVVRVALRKKLPLTVGLLVDELHMSERTFHRKLKLLTGMTPNKYILEFRLHTARQLLEQRAYATVAEISFAVGFDTPRYFSTQFEQRFGMLPGSYFGRGES